MGIYDVVLAQHEQAARQAARAENRSRWAISQHVVETSGPISLRYARPIIFEAPFLNAPYVMTGLAIKGANETPSGWIPRASAGVWQWERDTNGNFTGAYVFVAVDGIDDVALQHHFTFSGIAYKDFGSEIAADAQMLTARPVGFGGA